MHTSAAGVRLIEDEEEVVLKTYLCPAGVPTIGAGLTKASGVIDPKPGMIITRKEASRLLADALKGNYEPAVRAAMPNAQQHEFDGGVSFHFNTGAIKRASWVRFWLKQNWVEVERRLKLWNKGDGRVLRGLVRRRHKEFRLIRHGDYGVSGKAAHVDGLARFVRAHLPQEVIDIREAFALIGYDPGSDEKGIKVAAIRKFQEDHALTVDGIVGRATLSTLQRMLDARTKATTVSTTTVGGSAATGVGGATDALPIDQAIWIGSGIIVVGLVAIGWVAWRYRDALAVKVQGRFPKIAKKLRGLS